MRSRDQKGVLIKEQQLVQFQKCWKNNVEVNCYQHNNPPKANFPDSLSPHMHSRINLTNIDQSQGKKGRMMRPTSTGTHFNDALQVSGAFCIVQWTELRCSLSLLGVRAEN